ncbi:uncharacterized protein NEMAJ01_0717 [Nematocida major]|uniref:uncharacterized protein n=1 Tax=Nematocida major TaxID=1912982 RepID=UPI00200781BF|nr:uncharacterized protein NEMAJ01_0717 [Nematocida major]KAH9385821.1 hypothetical protein NEMAJ01_0717 [Nematocida major]
MDSEDKRSAIVSGGGYPERAAAYPSRDSSHNMHRKHPSKTPVRIDAKKPELDKKKKKPVRKEEEKALPEAVIPPKRERKGLQLVFMDGSALTENLVQEELKKHHIEVDTKEEPLAPAPHSVGVSAETLEEASPEDPSEKGDDSQGVESDLKKHEDEKDLLIEGAFGKVSPQGKDEKKEENSEKDGEKQEEIKSEAQKHPEESLPASTPEAQTSEKEEAPLESAEPESALPKMDCTVKGGVPVGTDPETGEKIPSWDARMSDAIRKNVFTERKAPISAKTLPPRPRKKAEAEKKPAPPQEQPKTPRESPPEKEEKETVKEQETVKEEKETVKEQETVEEPETIDFSAEMEITHLPILYSKKTLLALRDSLPELPPQIDRTVLAKSFLRKKKEFRSFKTQFKDARKTAPVTQFEEVEPYEANFNLALNQVSQNNIREIAKRILAVKPPSEAATIKLATAFFNKVMQEHAYTAIYASLVEKLQHMLYAKEEKKGTGKSLFVRTISNLAQTEFSRETHWASTEETAQPQSLSAQEITQRVTEISNNKEKEYERILTKKRALTLVSFIVEMYLQGIFSDNLMHSAVHNILERKCPENVERLCFILKHAGKRFDQPLAREFLRKYIQWLETAIQDLSIRYRFMVEEVLDLARNNWVSKEERREEEESEWKSSKVKEKKKPAVKAKRAVKVAELVEEAPEEAARMESIVVKILKEDGFEPAKVAGKLSAEFAGNVLFFLGLVKITVEGYDRVLENGMGLVREWVKIVPERREEVLEYVSVELLPDLVDDSPHAPEHLKKIRKFAR